MAKDTSNSTEQDSERDDNHGVPGQHSSLRDDADPPRKGNPVLVGLLLLALGGIGAAGFYGYSSSAKAADLQKKLDAAEAAKNDTATEMAVMKSELGDAEANLAAAQNELDGLKEKMSSMEGDLDSLRKDQEAREAELAEFKKITDKFKKMIDSGQLDIKYRRGRMIVKLPSGVLFASGSADLSEKGIAAIKEVATILKEVPDRRFIVAGHTDNVPVKNEVFTSNWALSSTRAVRVTEALIASGMEPNRLSASGFSSYDPIWKNRSKKGRQMNRRIEIVLEPVLKPIKLLDGDDKE